MQGLALKCVQALWLPLNMVERPDIKLLSLFMLKKKKRYIRSHVSTKHSIIQLRLMQKPVFGAAGGLVVRELLL